MFYWGSQMVIFDFDECVNFRSDNMRPGFQMLAHGVDVPVVEVLVAASAVQLLPFDGFENIERRVFLLVFLDEF